jgi:hypothetical protein
LFSSRELDAEEKSVLTHTSSESENMDGLFNFQKVWSFIILYIFIDTGFFSIQVLQRALKMFEIELIPFASQEPIAKQARNSPESSQAYICNLGLHWFTLRRFGRQYFNLNSLYYVPEFVSTQILQLYLNLIKENGYSVFIVNGTLPECLANQQLSANPIGEMEYKSLIKDLPKFIMDGQVLDNLKDSHKHGKQVVRLPRHLYDEFQKNPNDPRIRELINAQLPKEMISDNSKDDLEKHELVCTLSKELYDEFKKNPNNPVIREMISAQLPEDMILDEISEHPGCSNPHQHHHHQLLVTAKSKRRDSQKYKLTFQLSKELYDEFKKNPNNPVLREMISAQLSEDMILDEISEHPGCSNPHQNHHHQLLVTAKSKRRTGEQLTAVCNCQNCRQDSQLVPKQFAEQVTVDSNIDDPNQRHHGSTIITEHLTQYIIEKRNPNNPNAPPQHQVVTNRVLIMSRSSHRNNTLIDDQDIQQMTEPSIGFENDDDILLEHAMAQSLLSASETNEDINIPSLEERLEKIYQKSLDEAIAASLITNNSSTKQSQQTPEIIPITTMNSSPTPMMTSAPVTTKILSSSPPPTNTYSPSSTNTHSPPLMNTYSPSPTNTTLPPLTNTYAAPPTNTSSPPPTNMYPTPPTDTSSPPPKITNSPLPPPASTYPTPPTNTSSPPPKTTNSPPPTVTDSDSLESPSIEGKLFKTILH